MSSAELIDWMTGLLKLQMDIIKAQAEALEQVGAVVMEEERADVGRALTAMIGNDEAPDLLPNQEGGTTVKVFYFCNGKDPDCSHEDCHMTGGNCCHTIDRAFAKETDGVRLFEETDGVRLFEETDPDSLFEIDPDKL